MGRLVEFTEMSSYSSSKTAALGELDSVSAGDKNSQGNYGVSFLYYLFFGDGDCRICLDFAAYLAKSFAFRH